MRPPTKDEHDAIVAARGRSYTDNSMRHAKPDEDTAASEPTLIDGYIAYYRKGTS